MRRNAWTTCVGISNPAMDDVFTAAGFSVHGYKFCGVIRRVMADFCPGEEGKWGLEGFSDAGREDIVTPPLRGGVPREATGVVDGGAGFGGKGSPILDAH